MTISEVNNYASKIIAHAGDSKSYSMEALENVEENKFEEAKECLENSYKALIKAHEIHTELLVMEAKDPGSFPMTLMLIHASNHLSNAEISREFSERMIRLLKK